MRKCILDGGVQAWFCYPCFRTEALETPESQLKQPTPTGEGAGVQNPAQGTTERLRGIPEGRAGSPETAERLNAISERVHKAEWNKRGSKYGNVKTEVGGLTFDSRKEADYYKELCLREAAGEIRDIVCQHRLPIEVNGKKICVYFADFSFIKVGGGSVFVDVKGYRTPVYRIKKKLVKAIYGVEITEVS